MKFFAKLFKKKEEPKPVEPKTGGIGGFVTIDQLWKEADGLAAVCGMTSEQAFKHFEQDTFPTKYLDYMAPLKLRWQLLVFCNGANNDRN